MKIQVKLEVSNHTNEINLDLDDLDLTVEEWNNMSKEQKESHLRDWVDTENDNNPPYWMIDQIVEEID